MRKNSFGVFLLASLDEEAFPKIESTLKDILTQKKIYVSVLLHQPERTNIGSAYVQSIGSCMYVYIAMKC